MNALAKLTRERADSMRGTWSCAAGKEQAVVFELGKDIVRTTVKILERRSGKDVIYQDDEARKSLGGGKAK